MALPDDIITQRAGAERAMDANEGEDSDGQEGEERGATAPESGPRRRRPARLPEPEEKLRGRRQKDFDNSEQNTSSDEESQRRERGHTAEEPWTQTQQKLLELALQQYPKGSSDRWDKIAKCVPSKSKVGEAGTGAPRKWPQLALPNRSLLLPVTFCLHLSTRPLVCLLGPLTARGAQAGAWAVSAHQVGGRSRVMVQPGELFPEKTAHIDHKFHPQFPASHCSIRSAPAAV